MQPVPPPGNSSQCRENTIDLPLQRTFGLKMLGTTFVCKCWKNCCWTTASITLSFCLLAQNLIAGWGRIWGIRNLQITLWVRILILIVSTVFHAMLFYQARFGNWKFLTNNFKKNWATTWKHCHPSWDMNIWGWRIQDPWICGCRDNRIQGSMDAEIHRSDNGDSSICGSVNVGILGSEDLWM